MLCIWTEPKHTHKKTSNKTHSQSLLLKNQQQQKSLHHHHQQQYSYNTFCDFLNTWLVEMYEGFSQQWWQIAASETGRTLQTMTTQNLWRLQEVLWDSCVCACVFIKTKKKKTRPHKSNNDHYWKCKFSKERATAQPTRDWRKGTDEVHNKLNYVPKNISVL